MKKLIGLTAISIAGLLACDAAIAGKKTEYEKAGQQFAQVTACVIADKLEKGHRDVANLKIIGKYRVAKRGDWWKAQMDKARLKEFDRLANTNILEMGIMCGIVKERYL